MPRLMERNPGLPPRILPSSVRTGILLFVMAVACRGAGVSRRRLPGRLSGWLPGGLSRARLSRPESDTWRSPCPGRSSRNKTPAPNQNGPLPNFRGNLKVFADKTLSVELGDKRIMDFRRTEKTKFFKAGDEVKTPKFKVGDQVSVEAQTDPGGQSMTAVNVYWEKAGGTPSTSSKSDDGVVDTWKDDPKPAPRPHCDRSGGADRRRSERPRPAEAEARRSGRPFARESAGCTGTDGDKPDPDDTRSPAWSGSRMARGPL